MERQPDKLDMARWFLNKFESRLPPEAFKKFKDSIEKKLMGEIQTEAKGVDVYKSIKPKLVATEESSNRWGKTIGNTKSRISDLTREVKNSKTVLNRIGLSPELQNEALDRFIHKSELLSDKRAHAADTIRMIRNPAYGAEFNPQFAKTTISQANRIASLKNRIAVALGQMPKLLKGAFIPPIDFEEESKKSEQKWMNDKLNGA